MMPIILYLLKGNKLWIQVSSKNFFFYFIRFTKASEDIDEMIKRYEENFSKLSKKFNYTTSDSEWITVYLYPSQILSQILNKRKLNFVKINEKKIFIIHNNIVSSSPTHELVHILTYKYFGNIDSGLKKVLFEGLATAITYSRDVNDMLIKRTGGRIINMKDIIEENVPKDIFYFASGSFVIYLFKTFDANKLLNMCHKPDFKKYFDTNIHGLEAGWNNFLKEYCANKERQL